MIRKKTEGKPVIDLTGPKGNAFFLLGQATRWAKDLGLNGNEILDEMRDGDYEHLVETFEKYFGDYCILER